MRCSERFNSVLRKKHRVPNDSLGTPADFTGVIQIYTRFWPKNMRLWPQNSSLPLRNVCSENGTLDYGLQICEIRVVRGELFPKTWCPRAATARDESGTTLLDVILHFVIARHFGVRVRQRADGFPCP